MSTIRVNAIQNTSGVEVYTAKAWVNFNGTGTVAIRASGNVSSITDLGVGTYTINFVSALPDANYSPFAWAYGGTVGTSSPLTHGNENGLPTVNGFRLSVITIGATFVDQERVFAAAFR